VADESNYHFGAVPWYRQPTWQFSTTFLLVGVLLLGGYLFDRVKGTALPQAYAQLSSPHQVLGANGPTGIQLTTTSSSVSDAPYVVIYQDYQDLASADIDLMLSDALNALGSRGEIIVEYRTMTFLDHNAVSGASQRAAIGAACADIQGVFAAYHYQIFQNQNSNGFSDTQLRDDFAIAAGLSGDKLSAFQACYDNRLTEDFVNAIATQALADGVTVIPTYLANGTSLDLADLELINQRVSETSLRTAIETLKTSA
jgi:protein-disulfide isomerase